MRHRIGLVAGAVAALLCVAFPGAPASAEEEAGPAGDVLARQVLDDMAAFLVAQKAFRVDIATGYDAMQASGQKVEFLDKRTLTVRRPDGLKLEVERSDGERSTVIINKSTITAVDRGRKVYAQTASRGSLDESIAYFVRDLQMRLPLAILLVSNLSAELANRVENVAYVERTSILGEPCHHIVGSTDTTDFQAWIGAGKAPLIHRLVITYAQAEGQPQFRASFSNWDLSPSVRNWTFEARVPSGSRQIAFLDQVAVSPANAPATPAKGASR